MTTDAGIRVGQVLAVEALRLNDDGDGVASVNGMTLFVVGLLPGERAEVQITRVERRFARAKLVSLSAQAPSVRTSPLCGVFESCGGCQLQHVSYEAQLLHKQKVVEGTLARMAKLPDVEVSPTLGMTHPWRYRNQVQVPLEYHAETNTVVTGFFQGQSHSIVETDVCHLETTAMESLIQMIRVQLPDWLGKRARHIHHLIVRQSFLNGQLMVIFVTEVESMDWSRAIEGLSVTPNVASIAMTHQPKRNGPVWGKTVNLLFGEPYLTERIDDLEFLISPRSFFQVNTRQTEVLYRCAVDFAELQPHHTVLDAYCGTGTMTLMFARHAQFVTGIETIRPAILDARNNALHNRLENTDFVVGNVEDVLPKWVQEGKTFDVVVLDPPRVGCDPLVIASILRVLPERVVYVSCSHATFARDARLLVDGGYQLTKVQPVDMFPQTSHVECVGQFIRVKE